MRLPVFLLALGTFTVGTSEFVITGILPLLAADLDISVGIAGQLVTAYALAFGLGAPAVAALTGRMSRRAALAGLLGAFAVGSVCAAAAPSYAWLLVARVVVAIAAGTYEVVATAAAATLVPPPYRGRAIAIVGGGFAAALVLGVPLGTVLGLDAGWRATFGVLAVAGAVVAIGLLRLLPVALAPSVPSHGAGGARRIGWHLVPALSATGLLFAGQYVVSTYYAPLLEERAAVTAAGVAGLLMLGGAAALAGTAAAGYASDRWGIRRTALAASSGIALALLVFWLLGTTPVGAALAMGLSGASIGAFVPTWQHHLLLAAPASGDLALALNLTALNAGIAGGAVVGGWMYDRGGLELQALVGAALAMGGAPLVSRALHHAG